MIGIGELLLSYLRRQIGLRTDASSSSGSVHAKLGYLKDYILSTGDSLSSEHSTIQSLVERAPWVSGKNVNVLFGFDNTSRDTGGAWGNVFSLSGPIQVFDGYIQIDTTNGSCYFEFTIDNHVKAFNAGDLDLAKYGVEYWFKDANYSGGQTSFSWIIPRLYSNFYNSTTTYATPPSFTNGVIISIPFIYVNTLLRLRFGTNANTSVNPFTWWSIWYNNV